MIRYNMIRYDTIRYKTNRYNMIRYILFVQHLNPSTVLELKQLVEVIDRKIID